MREVRPVTGFRDEKRLSLIRPFDESFRMATSSGPVLTTRTTVLGIELEQSRFEVPEIIERDAPSSTRAEETRAAIMAAARVAFLENGISATRLAAIARASWFAPSTVSLHFKGKEALFAACLEEDIAQLFAGAQASVAGHPYPLLSGDFIRALTTQLRGYPLLATVLAHSSGTWGVLFYESAELEVAIDALCNDLARAQSEGIARSDLDPAKLGRSLGSVIAGTLWPVFLQHGKDHALTEQSLALILDSVLIPETGNIQLAERVAHWRKVHPWFPLRRQQAAAAVRPLEARLRQAGRS
jgi:AcrR family transcriptional regulator